MQFLHSNRLTFLPALTSPSFFLHHRHLCFLTMVKSNTTVMVVSMFVGLIFAGLPCLQAQSPMGAPSMSPGAPTAMTPPTDCTTALGNVTDCFNFVLVGSNMTVPDKGCCPEFAGLLESNPICLCQLVDQSAALGIDIDRALMIPTICKVETPSLDSCPATPTPAPAPGSGSETPGSPSDAPGSAAVSPMTDGGTALSPSGSGNSGTNGASNTAVHDFSSLICLAVAIFIANYF